MARNSSDINSRENLPLLRSSSSHPFFDSPIGSFKGPNSLQNFANSFTRAQSFAASRIDNDIHRSRSFFHSDEGAGNSAIDDEYIDPDLMAPSSRGKRLSQAINDMNAIPRANGGNNYNIDGLEVLPKRFPLKTSQNQDFLDLEAVPSSPHENVLDRTFSISSNLPHLKAPSVVNLKTIESRDGKPLTILAGQSTAPQTTFNSINVLIGVGLLALPVGLTKAGWVYGISILVACGLACYWTATLVSKAMDTDDTIMTYADIGYAAYGSSAKLLVSLLLSIDLLGAGVCLIILLSDSLYALVGEQLQWSQLHFKVLSFFLLLPFVYLPLPILSVFSLVGIMSTISITLLVFICGIVKSDTPGSLRNIMPTNMWPVSNKELFIAIGILMAPFGGHAIFPNLKADMRHPHKFTKSLSLTYTITLFVDSTMAILGYLMFGNYCNSEITNSILLTTGYPVWCYSLLSCLICFIPLAKVPLNAKPIILTLEYLLNIEKDINGAGFTKKVQALKFFIKIFVIFIFVFLATTFPEFDKVIGILGASVCFVVCIVLPCIFYLKLCKYDVEFTERLSIYFAVTVSVILALSSTWAILDL